MQQQNKPNKMRIFALLFIFLVSSDIYAQQITNNIRNKDSLIIEDIIDYVEHNYKEHIKINISISSSNKASHANIKNNSCRIYLGKISPNNLLENYEHNLRFILLHEIAHCLLGNKIKSELKYTKKMFSAYHETFADMFASTYFIKQNNLETVFLLNDKRQIQYIQKVNKNYNYYLFPYVFFDFINKENITFSEMSKMSMNIVENYKN